MNSGAAAIAELERQARSATERLISRCLHRMTQQQASPEGPAHELLCELFAALAPPGPSAPTAGPQAGQPAAGPPEGEPTAGPAGADPQDLRTVYLRAVAEAYEDPELAERLRTILAEISNAYLPVIAEHLERIGRRPAPGAMLSDLPQLTGALVQGLIVGAPLAGPTSPPELAQAVLAALRSWTQPLAKATEEREGYRQQALQRVRDLDAELESVELCSERGLELAGTLMNEAPTSTIAFWIARRHAAAILATPGIRETEPGAAAWRAAAEMLSMADADRPLAEEVASYSLSQATAAQGAGPIALIRTAWLLLRLEEFDAALDLLAELRASAPVPAMLAAADVLEAYARCATGSLDEAVALGLRATESGVPIASEAGAAIAARAHVRAGRISAAEEVIEGAPDPSTPPTLGESMLFLARGIVHVHRERPLRALDDLTAVADQMRRVGSINPAGFPWLEPAVRALVMLGQRDRAARLIETQRQGTERWNTPLVLAELALAQAHLAEDPAGATRLRRRALNHLAESRTPLFDGHVRALLGDAFPAANSAAEPAAAAPELSVRFPALTPRLAQIAELVALGRRNAEISAELGISIRTAESHVSAALKLTGSRNRVELARIVNNHSA